MFDSEIVLLPGLDGTGDLLERFVAAAPVGGTVRVLRFPREQSERYEDLAEWICSQLPSSPTVLVAESFSGPLAMLVADRCPTVSAVVLCATFVASPLPTGLRKLAGIITRRPPPVCVISWLMSGGDTVLAKALRDAVERVDSSTIVRRIDEVFTVDVSAELQRFSKPLLCIFPTRDRLVPARAFSKIRRLKPSAKFVEIEGPHLILQANPVAAWEHIRSFLEDSSARAAG